MIHKFLVDRLGPRLATPVLWLMLGLLVIALLATGKCALDRGAKTEARLSRNQTDAAVNSGRDAVETVGERAASEAAGERVVKETEDEIQRAEDAGAVTDAGRDGLCRLAGYSKRPECLRRPSPE